MGGGFFFLKHFHRYLVKWSNLTNIFEMGWNHQPVNVGKYSSPIRRI